MPKFKMRVVYMKKQLLCLYIVAYIASVAALPTLTMPNLTYAVDNTMDSLSSANVVPSLSAAVRDALINSEQFKLIDTTTYESALVPESVQLTPLTAVVTTNARGSATKPGESQLVKAASSGIMSMKTIRPVVLDTLADYYLLGNVSYINGYENSYPIANTSNLTKQYTIEITANFKLIRNHDKQVMAAFTVSGRAHDVKIVPLDAANVTLHHNTGKLLAAAERDLARHVLKKLDRQLASTMHNAGIYHKPQHGPVITDVQVYK